MNDFIEKYLPLINKNMLPLILAAAGVLFLGYGFSTVGGQKQPQNGQDILFESASAKQDSVETNREIAVDVEGAVMKPGVYKLKEGSRIQDALIAAGGMSEDADREKAAKGLNLASKVTDGAKIYIPAQGESVAVSGGSGTSAVMGDSSSTVNINSASSSELEALPGIGSVTAGKIIDNRPYATIEDLLGKKVVGKSVFEKIKEKISI